MPGESLEVRYSRGDACFCKFADSKKDIGPCVVGEVKKSTQPRQSRRGGLVVFVRHK